MAGHRSDTTEVESRKDVNSDEEFTEIKITVTPALNQYIYWKKIKFEYK